jgi:RNA polymerase sigma factor (sigma-70 family)
MNTAQDVLTCHLRTIAVKQATAALSDQQLLEAFLTQRSEASFTALVERHGSMVFSVCRRVLHHAQDAEDAFQATFLVLARNAGSIRKRGSVSSFLHGVAYHTATKLRLASARRTRRERKCDCSPSLEGTDDITWRELRLVLDEELARLPEHSRAPLVLCYLEGRTQDEAARQLGWSKGTFRRRLDRARDLLRRRLTRRGLALSAALCTPLLAGLSAPAAMPATLARSATRTGLRVVSGEPMAGVIPGRVAALANGGLLSGLTIRVKTVSAVLLTIVLAGSGFLAHQQFGPAQQPAQAAQSLPATPPPAPPAPSEASVLVQGTVLGPAGQPVAGAKLYMSTYTYQNKTDPKVRAETGADGRFRFSLPRTEVDQAESVVAVAPGLGPDWVSLKKAVDGELTLRLVKDDVPIQGRILDLEGRPIAGATIRLIRVRKMPAGDLTPWIEALQAKPGDRNAVGHVHVRYERILSSVWGVLGVPRSVLTDAEGRFRLTGFGREREVRLQVEGPGIEYRSVAVITRPGLKGLPPDTYGATFDHLAAPSKPIRGTVREKDTGKPVPGVQVGCQAGAGEGGNQSVTDERGRYEILGIRKSDQYWISVGAPPIIPTHKEVADTPGLSPVTADFEVERGLVVRLRITEKGTGKPLGGLVQYAVSSDNPSLGDYTTFAKNVVSWSPTERDGSFEFVALPGPGYVLFRANDERFTRARLAAKENERWLFDTIPSLVSLDTFHAVVPINPSARDAKSLAYDVVVDPGRSLSGRTVDPDGRPLAGALAVGLISVFSLHSSRDPAEKLPVDFQVSGLEPRHPRAVVFYHVQKKLAKTVLLRGDEKQPLSVLLETLGSIRGRLVDAAGQPRAGIKLKLTFAEKQQERLPADLTMSQKHPLRDLLLAPTATTDKDGQFQIDGLVAGMEYALIAFRSDKRLDGAKEGITARPGATTNLGAIRIGAPPDQGAKGEDQ